MGNQILNFGMVGGGQGAFIGDVHRTSAQLDGQAKIAAASFSRNYDNSLQTGEKLGMDPGRIYKTYSDMAVEEAKRPDGIDFVIIVTPNNLHFEVAKAFLEQGIHVVCDKPLVLEVEEGEELKRIADEKGLLFCVTYSYTGYTMVKQARQMIQNGSIGDVLFVNTEYPSQWLAEPVEQSGANKQASWRGDPAKAGVSNCVGDIGTHAENLVYRMTGLEIESLCARLDTFVEGRVLDDNATVMANYKGKAKGVYWMSQVAYGNDNGLKIRIFGSKGSISWNQEDPNYLKVTLKDKPDSILSRERDPLYSDAAKYNRMPAGHPEGYYEALANIYKAYYESLRDVQKGVPVSAIVKDYPTIEDGIQGVKFTHRCVESSQKGAVWVDF